MIPMVFLGVVHPMTHAEDRGRNQLQLCEDAVYLVNRRMPAEVQHQGHEEQTQDQTDRRRQDDEEHCLFDPGEDQHSTPPFTRPVPISPPIRGWEELLGSPRYQVIRFQAMAPARAAKMTASVMIPGWMIPVPIVVATGTPTRKKATKLKKAAQRTAWLGVRTRVETMVEMALAASWNPLMKSKASAVRTRKRTSARSAIFQDDPFHDIGDVFTIVDRLFHPFVISFHLIIPDIGLVHEEVGHGGSYTTSPHLQVLISTQVWRIARRFSCP